MLYQVEDYLDWIEEMYSATKWYYRGIKDDIENEVWRQTREKEQLPHIGNIVFDTIANAIIRAIIEKESLDEDKVWEQVQIYPDATASYISVGETDVTEFEQLKKAILKISKRIDDATEM